MTTTSGLLALHGGLRTELADWFPRVQAIDIPVPRTVIVPVNGRDLFPMYDGEDTPEVRDIIARVTAAAEEIGYPAFIRTGLTSGKHGWKWTCYLDAPENVARNISGLFEYQEMVGLEWIETFALREMLPTTPLFHAFEGMPITKERRYFASHGKVYDHHPYWPAGAIDGHGATLADWEDALRADSVESDAEVAELTALTERVSAALPGAWSIDWLHTDRGWVFIDAAWAESSYVMPNDERVRLHGDAAHLAPESETAA